VAQDTQRINCDSPSFTVVVLVGLKGVRAINLDAGFPARRGCACWKMKDFSPAYPALGTTSSDRFLLQLSAQCGFRADNRCHQSAVQRFRDCSRSEAAGQDEITEF
jgi:hypothetical protein